MTKQLNLVNLPAEPPLKLTKDEIIRHRRLFGKKVFTFLAIKYDLQYNLIDPKGGFSESEISEFIDRWHIDRAYREIRDLIVQLSESGYLSCAVDIQLSFVIDEKEKAA